MKTLNLLRSVLLFSACVLMETSTVSAQQHHQTRRNNREQPIYRFQNFPDQLHGNRHSHHLILPQNQNRQQKPTTIQSRLKAIAAYENDGVQYIPEDSSIFFWSGIHHKTGVAIERALEWNFYYPNFSLWLEVGTDEGLIIDADSIINYEWDDSASVYEFDEKWIESLNNEGLVSSETDISYTGSGWVNASRNIYTYNNHSKMTSNTKQGWDGATWNNNEKTLYAFDTQNNVINYTELEWNTSASAWDSSYRIIYNYDAQNNLIRVTFRDWVSGSWVNNLRFSFSYTAGNQTGEIDEYWDSGSSQWVNDIKEAHTYNSNNNRIKDQRWEWNTSTSAWENSQKETYTFNSSNKVISTIYQYWNAGSWKYDRKEVYTYSGNNLTKNTDYEWNDSISQMEKYELSVFSYNNYNQCTKAELDDWDGTQWQPYNGYDSKEYFYYETYDDGLGIQQVINQNAFKLFPNPAKDKITIEMGKGVINNVSITNVSGKVVFQNKTELQASKLTIPVSQLSPGIYYVQIESGGAKGVKAFVVQ